MIDEIKALFRIIATEFADKTDQEVEAKIEFALPLISQKAFGELYTRAVALFVANMFALDNITQAEGSTSGLITGGAVTREKEGDLERSYGTSNSNNDDLLSKTVYGRQYLQLKRMCIMAVKTRFG